MYKECKEVIENLAHKGIDVTQIEFQTKSTEDKIAELDKKLEELPVTRENMITLYKIEKAKQLKDNNSRDYVKERSEENLVLHSNLVASKFNEDVNIRSSGNILLKEDTLNVDNVLTTFRRR